MSRRNKLLKFAELASFPNVYENFSVQEPQLVSGPDTPVELKGKWASLHFGNDKPITLELACGRGEYTVGLARQFPERSFIGVDIKGARIWQGARENMEIGLELDQNCSDLVRGAMCLLETNDLVRGDKRTKMRQRAQPLDTVSRA